MICLVCAAPLLQLVKDSTKIYLFQEISPEVADKHALLLGSIAHAKRNGIIF